MPTDLIVHMYPLAELRASDEPITAPSLDTEGLVHCSPDEATMLHVANTFYRNENQPMVALLLDPEMIGAPIRFEAPSPPSPEIENLLFPHVYGPIPRSAIVAGGTDR